MENAEVARLVRRARVSAIVSKDDLQFECGSACREKRAICQADEIASERFLRNRKTEIRPYSSRLS